MDSSISRRTGVPTSDGRNAMPLPLLANVNVSRPPVEPPSQTQLHAQRLGSSSSYPIQPLPTSNASPFSPLSSLPASPLAFPSPNSIVHATASSSNTAAAIAIGPAQWNTALPSPAAHSPVSPTTSPYIAAASPMSSLSSPNTPYSPTPASAISTTVRRKVHVAASSTAVDMSSTGDYAANESYSSKPRRAVKSSRSHSCLSPFRTFLLLLTSLLIGILYWSGVITPYWGALFGPAYPPAAPYLQIISVIRDMDAQLVQQNPAEMTLQLNAILSWVDAVSTPPSNVDSNGIISPPTSRAELVHVYVRDIRTCSYLRSASPRLAHLSCHGFPAVDSRTGHALLYPLLAHAHARMEDMDRGRVQMLRAAQIARGRVRKHNEEDEDDEENATKQYVMLMSGHGSTSVSPLVASQLQYVDSNVESTSLYSLTSSLIFMHTRSTLSIPMELIRSRLVGSDSMHNTQELLKFADEEAEESVRVEKAQLYARARQQEVDEVLMNPDGIGSNDAHTAASTQHAAAATVAKLVKPAVTEDTTPPPQLSYLIYERSLVFDLFPNLPRRSSIDTDWSSRTKVNDVVRTKNASLAESKDTLRKMAPNQNAPVPPVSMSSLPRLYAAFHGWEPLVFCALHKLKRIQAQVVDLSLLKNSAHAHATSMAKASSKKKQVYQRIQMQHLAEHHEDAYAAEEKWADQAAENESENANEDASEGDDDEASDMLALTESSPHNLAIAKNLCGRFYANAGLDPTIPYALVPQDRAQFKLEQQQHDSVAMNTIDKTQSWDREQPKEKTADSNVMQCPPFCLLRQSVPSLIPAYNASNALPPAAMKDKHFPSPSVSFTPRAELLLRYADSNGWVTIFPVDTLSLPFAFNWLCWAEGLGSFRNFVFLAEDMHSAKELHNRNYPVLLSPDPQLKAVSSMIVSQIAPFERRMKHRWGVANEALRAGINVYFASVKAVWYRSPLNYIDRKSVSVLAQLSFLSSLLQIFHVVPQGDSSHIAVRADPDGRRFSHKMRKCHKENMEKLKVKRERQLRENAALGFSQNTPSVGGEDPSNGFDPSMGEVPASATNVDTPTAAATNAAAEEELIDCLSETLKVLQQRHMAEQAKRAKMNPKAAAAAASSMIPQSNVPKAPLRDRFGRMVRQPTAAAVPTQALRSTFLDTFNPFLMPDGWTAMEEFEPQNRFIQPFMLSLTSTSADIKEGVKRNEEAKQFVHGGRGKKQIIASDEEAAVEDQIANYRLVESQWHTLHSWNLNLLRPMSSILSTTSEPGSSSPAGGATTSRVRLDKLEHGDEEETSDEGEEETQLLGRRDSPIAAEALNRRKRHAKSALLDGILPPVSIASLYPTTAFTTALLASNPLGLAGSEFSTACRIPKRPNPPVMGDSKVSNQKSASSVSSILASVSKLRAAVTAPQSEPVITSPSPAQSATPSTTSSAPTFDLTVRILAYARPKRLKRLLDSAQTADYPPHARVHFQIYVDSPASLDKASSSSHSASASISAFGGENSAATEPDVAGWLDVHSVIEEFEQTVRERFSRPSIGESARITVNVKRMERHAGVNAMWTQPFDEKSSIESSTDIPAAPRNESATAQASSPGKHRPHLLMVLSDDQELNFSWYSWLTRVLSHFYFSNGFDSRIVGLSLSDMHVSLSEPLDRPLREALFASELLGDLSSVKQSWYKLQQWRSSAFLFFPFHYRAFLTWLARRHSFHALTSKTSSPSSSVPASPLSRAAFISRLDRYTPCVPGLRTNLLWPMFRDRVQQALFGVDTASSTSSDLHSTSTPTPATSPSIISGDVWWIWLNRFLFEKGLYSLYVHLKDTTSYPARTQYLTLGHVERQRFESMHHLDDSYETILGEGEELLIEIGITEPAENEQQPGSTTAEENQQDSGSVATVDEYYEQFKEPFSDPLAAAATFPASNAIPVYDPLFRRVPSSFEEVPFKPTPGVSISAMETQLSASPVSLLHLRSSSVPPLVYDQCFLARATPTSVLRSQQRLRLSQVHKDLFIHFKKGRFYTEEDLVRARNQDMLRITVREQRRAAEEALAEHEAEQRMIERRKQREKQLEEQLTAQAKHAISTTTEQETHRDDSL